MCSRACRFPDQPRLFSQRKRVAAFPTLVVPNLPPRVLRGFLLALLGYGLARNMSPSSVVSTFVLQKALIHTVQWQIIYCIQYKSYVNISTRQGPVVYCILYVCPPKMSLVYECSILFLGTQAKQTLDSNPLLFKTRPSRRNGKCVEFSPPRCTPG